MPAIAPKDARWKAAAGWEHRLETAEEAYKLLSAVSIARSPIGGLPRREAVLEALEHKFGDQEATLREIHSVVNQLVSWDDDDLESDYITSNMNEADRIKWQNAHMNQGERLDAQLKGLITKLYGHKSPSGPNDAGIINTLRGLMDQHMPGILRHLEFKDGSRLVWDERTGKFWVSHVDANGAHIATYEFSIKRAF